MMLPVFFRVRTDIADLIELSTGEKVNFLSDLFDFCYFLYYFYFSSQRDLALLFI